VRGEDCIDGGGVNDESADVRLAMENMDESGESKNDEQGVAADHSRGRNEEKKRGHNFSASENRADEMGQAGIRKSVAPGRGKKQTGMTGRERRGPSSSTELKLHFSGGGWVERFVGLRTNSFSTLPFPRLALWLARRLHADFDEAMACRGIEVEVIELLEIADALKRGRSKGAFAIEGVEDDAFEKVAEGEVMVLGEGFQHLQDAPFHSDAGLDALDLELVLSDGCSFHMYLCTRVCWYRQCAVAIGPRRTVCGRG